MLLYIYTKFIYMYIGYDIKDKTATKILKNEVILNKCNPIHTQNIHIYVYKDMLLKKGSYKKK